MSWLDDMHANDPAYPAPGTGDPWQAPPTADWAALPTRAELDAATAHTAGVLADPAATRAQREHAAEMEQAAHILYLQRPGADAELQAEAELEAGT
jgi:hypothetical protein